jgi:two-component system chemotaxis response regulator CheB
MPLKDIVVVGASAGGVEALRLMVGALPETYKGSIFVVLHVGSVCESSLDRVLDRAGPLPAQRARNREEFKPGHIYVAPADHHLLLEENGQMRLTRGPRENRFRPAIDPLFRSAAFSFGPRVVGVILSGYLDDGTAGLWAVKERGGTAIVQSPETAIGTSMPLNALKHVPVDYTLEPAKIALILVELALTPATQEGVKPMSKQMEAEVKIAREDNALESGILEWGEASLYACPECHGVLLQLKEGSNIRFRCHTGHAYSVETLLSEFNQKTEEILWNALRSIEETVLLLKRMASHLSQHRHNEAADALLQEAKDAQARADRIRDVVFQQGKCPKNPAPKG